ncbi:bifunctional [glutamate--ammonia ligase]-adenylyl-L-tyrosine phosphorylase/[glutamate--ammonia-ligase] adenylyltransferase [Thalassotalea fusca]
MLLPELPEILAHHQKQAWRSLVERFPEFHTELDKNTQAIVKQAVTLSDFVFRSVEQAPEATLELFQQGHFELSPDYETLLALALEGCESEEHLHRMLRQFRLSQMVAIAVADLIYNIPLEDSLARLSSLADALILGALNWLTEFCQQRWGTPVNHAGEKQPLLVFGMGKLGGEELNFSSDIDLIFTYPESGHTIGARKSLDNQQFFTRLGQKLITALNQKTADGFVYRVDMRLRPFGDSGPLVLSFNAIEDYYQEQGRDWERYAMLKARLIGNTHYHQILIDMLRPFVYRRYIDFSVIDSLRRMKMMISQEVRRKRLTGNIKLGAGGIREIEFIVQVFQLIRGGRIKKLQQRNLLSVLPQLVDIGEISSSTKAALESAYRLLRRVENILQALNDAQTQTLPDDALNQARLVVALQHAEIHSWSELVDELALKMEAVHQEFIALIGEESPAHDAVDSQWQTLWDSSLEKEEQAEWLAEIAPAWSATEAACTISQFKQDINKRSLGQRGRQTLDKLMPLIFAQLAAAHAGEKALDRVLLIIAKVATRTAYLELLYENEGALKHLIKLCEASSWVTEHIAKYPILLDELIDPKLFSNPPALSNYFEEVRQVMLRIPEEDLEAQMDSLRQYKQAQHLRIAAADISKLLPITKVSDHLTAVAEAVIEQAINLSWQQVTQRFGIPTSLEEQEHKGFTVIGYGKLGGLELGYSSDLDLVFLHDRPADDVTNGEKSIPVTQFYVKLAQRILHFFNTRMTSGILYELDMRLRPSGNSGVLVVHIDSYQQYQENEAWTWEHQALVRARAVYGHQQIIERFNQARLNVLTRARDHQKLIAEVMEMRDKMRHHLNKSTDALIDIKHGSGGLIDIEFLVQYLALKFANQYPEVVKFSDNLRILQALCHHKLISEEQQKILSSNYCKLRDYGHRSALQNAENLMPIETFNNIEQDVFPIVQYYLPPSG